MALKQRMAAIAAFGALSVLSASAFSAPVEGDVYSSQRVAASRDVFTDGARVNGTRDVFSDGARVSGTRDVYSDGARVNDRRDAFSDGA